MASKQSVSYSQVYVSCDHAIKTHLNLEKFIPAIVKKKVLPKDIGKRIRKKKDTELLLGIMKGKPIKDFVIFLEVIQTLGNEDKDTCKLMKLMSGVAKLVETTDVEAKSAISRFIEASQEQTEVPSEHTQTRQGDGRTTFVAGDGKTQTDVSAVCPDPLLRSNVPTNTSTEAQVQPPETDKSQPPDSACSFTSEDIGVKIKASTTSSPSQSQQSTLPLANLHQPHRPPVGFIGECRSRVFTHEGGMLYLSEHGVTVIVPPEAVPTSVKFMMSAHVYLRGPFSLPDGVELCSAFVWFSVQPPLEFQADITVMIPHAAAIEEEEDECSVAKLGVYRVPNDTTGSKLDAGQVHELTECIPVDVSDGYHAVFKARHFSPYAVGKENTSESSKKQETSSTAEKLPNLHTVESRKKVVRDSSVDMSHRLRSFGYQSSSFESRCSFGDPDSGGSSPILSSSALKKDPNIQVTSSPLFRCCPISNLSGESSSKSGAGKRLSPKKKKSSTSRKGKGIKFCVTQCMPGDRSMDTWQESFVVTYSHPTAIAALKRFAIKQYGDGFQIFTRGVRFTDDELRLTPNEWTSEDNQWRVCANQTPEMSIEDVLVQLPDHSLLENHEEYFLDPSNACLPQITYTAAAQHASHSRAPPPASPLSCRVDVHGAERCSGSRLFFTLTSTCSRKKGGGPTDSEVHANHYAPRILHARTYLYERTSEVLAALHRSTDLQFDLQHPDHIKLLADLSYQLTKINLTTLRQIFQIEENQIDTIYTSEGRTCRLFEVVYRILRTWVSRKGFEAKLSLLRCLLHKINVSIKLHIADTDNPLLDPRLNSIALPCESPDTFVIKVSTKIQRCWKAVGRLVGLTETEIESAELQDPVNLHEQSYSMLYNWRRHYGNGATCGILFRAIHCVSEHDPAAIDDVCINNDAWCYSVHVASKLLEQFREPAIATEACI